MKNHRFPWLRNRTTDNRKCEKARNIKEKRTIEMFSTVSRKQEEQASSRRDNYGDASKRWKTCNYKVLQFVELAEKYRIGTSLQLNCNVLATNRKKKFFKDVIHKDSIFFLRTCSCECSYGAEQWNVHRHMSQELRSVATNDVNTTQ